MASPGDSTYDHILDGRKKAHLSKFDPQDTAGLSKEEALTQVAELGEELTELTNLLAYAGRHSMLVVVQGRDASGKDGALRKVLEFSNVLNSSVVGWKAPSSEELSHDFLWRIHKMVPGKGRLVLFNRSHYEDVIATRVHDLVPESVWRARYKHINRFEELLLSEGTIVLKFYLHISKEEQIQRLFDREEDPRTAWKLNVGDWRELPSWDKTTEAYEDAINHCSSPELPWHLVPADKKWFRNLAIIRRMVTTLRPYREGWQEHLQKLRRTALKEIRDIRGELGIEAGKQAKAAKKSAKKSGKKQAKGQ